MAERRDKRSEVTYRERWIRKIDSDFKIWYNENYVEQTPRIYTDV